MTWVHDGSFAGLLTAVFRLYEARDTGGYLAGPVGLKRTPKEPQLFSETDLTGGENCLVDTDEDLARRVIDGVHREAGAEAAEALRDLYLSEAPDLNTVIPAFVQVCLKWKKKVFQHASDPAVARADGLCRSVRNEVHRFQGLLRFQELADDQGFYAAFEPKHHVLPLLADFFADRIGDSRWMIHDVLRGQAAVFREGQIELLGEVELDGAVPLSFEEETFQSLWKGFFKCVAVPGRTNPKLQMGKMPKKYWKYLVEKN